MDTLDFINVGFALFCVFGLGLPTFIRNPWSQDARVQRELDEQLSWERKLEKKRIELLRAEEELAHLRRLEDAGRRIELTAWNAGKEGKGEGKDES